MGKINGLCVLLLLGVASACEHTPGISITPLSLEGLTGSCLLIPCNFRVNEGQDFPGLDSAAVWIRKQSQFVKPNSKFVVFNGSTSPYYPMEITGDVNKKDCTTLFSNLRKEYSDKYFFRVEDGGFRSTASCDPIHITVKDSAWSPSIEVSGEQTEAEVVTITCSAVTPCPHAPPHLTWDLQQSPTNHLQPNPDGTFNTTITHELSLTSSHHGFNVTCSATYSVNGQISPEHKAKTTITLNVTRTKSEKAVAVTEWLPAVCSIVLLALIGGIVYVWCVKFRRTKLQPAQVQIIVETTQHEPAQNEDGLHYGDISFNQRRSGPVSCTQEETVYSQVKVSNNNSRKATEMTDIYAQVTKPPKRKNVDSGFS